MASSSRLMRRAILRGLGVGLTLPLFDSLGGPAWASGSSFTPSTATTAVQPRIVFCYLPNGKNIFEWLPKTRGPGYELSPTLAPLKKHRDAFTVISGLGHPHAQGGHSGADTWLTGANLKGVPGAEYSNSVSVDQVIAEVHAPHTRFPSLQLSDLSGTGNPGHSNTLSFDRAGIPLPAETSPQRLFDRLFVAEASGDRRATLQRYAEQRSILDSIMGDAKALGQRLGKADQQKLGEYLGSVRSTEARVQRLTGWVDVPKPRVDPHHLQLGNKAADGHDRPAWLDVMLELSYLAFVTDTTRVITFEWSREASGFGGASEDHHQLSHHGGDPGTLAKLATVDRFHTGRLAHLLDLLHGTPEANGVMLDRTVVVYGCGMNSGEGGEHSPKDLPLLIAGGKSLGFRHGQHLRFEDRTPPLSNVLLTLAQKLGVNAKKFQDSTGTLPNLV